MTEHEFNPYAAPLTTEAMVLPEALTGAGDVAAAERVRRELLNHETSLKSVRLLFYAAGGSAVLVLLAMLIPAAKDAHAGAVLDALIVLVIWGLLAAMLLRTGYCLGALDRRCRWPVGIISGLGLLGFPVGTAINGYILYLVFSAKGRRVLSDEYKQVIRLTPHVKYRTAWWLWALLILFVVMIVLAIALSVG